MKWNQTKIIELKKFLTEDRKRDFPYKIPWKGDKLESFDVYTVPIHLLNYNFNNTRIRADLEAYLFTQKEDVNPESKKQQKIVQEILLTSEFISEEATRVLQKDLKSRGQLDPAVATLDGVLIDGNRRLAILNSLYDESKNDKFLQMEICVLPESAKENDLKELEMRMQMSHEFKVPYGKINTALEFRHLHRDLKWDFEKIEKITNRYYKKNEVERMIQVIDLIDRYLDELPPKGKNKKQYKLIEKKGWESFDNLHTYIKWSKENSGKRPTEFRQRFGFQIIRHENSTFNDVRNFGRIIKDKDLRRKLEGESDTIKGKNPTTYLNPVNVEREMKMFKGIKADYKESKEDPKKIAQQAFKKLSSIQPNKIKKGDQKLKEIFYNITQLINQLKSKI